MSVKFSDLLEEV